MKNRYIVFSALIMCSLLVCGCDAFRSLAGRPTSADIEEMRATLAAREAYELWRQDSLAKAQARVEDSLAALVQLDSLKQEKGIVKDLSVFRGVSSTMQLDNRYYVVLGSFKEVQNAEKYRNTIVEAGFEAVVIRFKNGFNSVGVCPTDSPRALLDSMEKLRQEPFCPKDFWILVNEQGHE